MMISAANHSVSRTPGTAMVKRPISIAPPNQLSDSTVEQRREERAGHHRHEHAQPHERVERAEHPAPQLVVDLLLQQHEAQHVDGPDGHAHQPDEQGAGPRLDVEAADEQGRAGAAAANR